MSNLRIASNLWIANLRIALQPSKLFWAAVLLLAGAAAWPLFSQSGLLNTRGGGDSPFLLQRLQQLTAALLEGHFPVRWMPDANYGYGYPFYNFYAPLSIYIAAFFRFLGFSFVGAVKLAQLAGFLVAAGAMFHLGRRWFHSHWAGLLAAAAYTFAPFHMVNVYVRGDSLAEFWAMAFYPLLLLALDHLINASRKRTALLLLALAYAALILSHNISALIFSPFLLLYLLFRLAQSHRAQRSAPDSPRRNKTGTAAAAVSLAFMLALALSAWFWLPALAEQGLAQLAPVTAGYFHFSNHFRGTELVQKTLLFDYDVAGGGAFRMGLVQTAVTLAGFALLLFRQLTIWRGKAGQPAISSLHLLFLGLAFLIATFMITPLSRPLWEHLPLLSFTQFPWRFFSVQAFMGAIASAGLVLLPGRKFIVPAAVLLILLSGLGNLRTDHLLLTDADVTAERLAEYEWFTGNIGSTVSAEYLPPSVRPRPYTSAWLNTGDRASILSTGEVANVRPLVQKTGTRSWLVSTPTAATITFPVMAWPGWQAVLDGIPVESKPAPGSGLAVLPVPAGEHTVAWRLTRTPVRWTAELISLTSVVVAGWLFWPALRRYAGRRSVKPISLIVISLILISLVLRLRPEKLLAADTLSWDFEQSGYLHHAPDGIPFEDGTRLLRYEYSRESVAAGEELLITLTWELTSGSPGGGPPATLALTTPAVHWIENAPLLISQEQPLRPGQVVYQFLIPDNAPAGLYVPRLIVAGVNALTSSGQRRGDLFLRPVRIVEQPGPPGQDAPPFDVRVIHAHQPEPDNLLIQLQWLTQQTLPQNYLVSLRLVDDQGLELAHLDTQPGYGFRPSSGWPAGQWTNDWLTLPLPADFAPSPPETGPYALVARLYDAETEEVALTRRLGELTWENGRLVFRETAPVFTLPGNINSAAVTFGDLIQLRGYTMEQTAGLLNLTLYWQALANGREDFYHFVHLVDAETGDIVAQHDSMPRNNAYPTGQWAEGEIVSDPLSILLESLPPGEYLLYVGFYRNLRNTFPRLPAVDTEGRPLADDRFLLQTISVEH